MALAKQNKQAAVLLAATFLGLIVGILNSVINTQSLCPEQYGDVRYVQNIISFVSSLLLFGYFVSGSRLLALEGDEDKKRHIRGILCVILGIAILVLMLVLAGFYLFTYLGGKDNLSRLFLLAIPLCGNVLMLNYVNTVLQGDNMIGRIAIARFLPSALYCLLAWTIYTKSGATPELMLALTNGVAIIVLLSILLSSRPSFKGLKKSFHSLNIENRKYGFNVYLGALANVATGYISGITLGQFCDNNANVGFYTLAVTISAPLAMLPSIIGTTYFKKFAFLDRIDGKVLTGSFLLTIGSCLLYILCIKYIVAFLYDESYAVVGTIAAWLAVGTSLHGLGDMFNRFLGAHGKGKEIRNGAFACGAVMVCGSILFVWLWEIKGAVVTKILSDSVYFVAMFWYYRRNIRT